MVGDEEGEGGKAMVMATRVVSDGDGDKEGESNGDEDGRCGERVRATRQERWQRRRGWQALREGKGEGSKVDGDGNEGGERQRRRRRRRGGWPR